MKTFRDHYIEHQKNPRQRPTAYPKLFLLATTPDMLAEAKDVAASCHTSLSAFIRESIRRNIKNYKQER